MSSEDRITLEVLLPLRNFMTPEQLERYGDYLSGRVPDRPFSREEVDTLTSKKEAYSPMERNSRDGDMR